MMNRIYIAIIILATILISFFVYERLTYLTVVVKFDELEPFEKQMSVYFKGFKVGKTVKIYPDENYENTYLKLKLHSKKIKLPSNVTADIKKKKIGGYVNILYPDNPSLTKLKENDEIKGIITKDLEDLLNGKFSDDDVDLIVEDATNLMESANNAISSLNEIFKEVNAIIKENRQNIKTAASNLTDTTCNLKEMSASLNKTVGGKQVENSIENIEKSTKNIQNITKNLDGITSQMDSTTMPIVNSVLCETHKTVKNTREITGGVKNTLKKHMGLSRLLFGRPISKDCCCD